MDGAAGLAFNRCQNFLRQHLIRGGAGAVFVVVDDRFAEAGRFRQSRAARDHRFKHPLAQQIPHFAHHFVRQLGAAVKHRHHHAEDFQPRIHARVAQLRQHAVHHRDAFQRVILALQRHQHAIRGRKRVQRQNAQRRRAIHEDQIKLARRRARAASASCEPQEMVFRPGQFHVRAAQIHFARDQGQPLEGGGL